MSIDRIAYIVRSKVPWLFNVVERLATVITALRHSRRRRAALRVGCLSGTVQGRAADIRPLVVADTGLSFRFFEAVPLKHLTHFRPHEFSRNGMRRILKSRNVCCYGLFVDERMAGYCLLRLFPIKRAYCGLLLCPEFTGLGLGKLLWRYLIWQAVLMGVNPNATVHVDNVASICSLRAVKPNIEIDPLTAGYVRVLIPTTPKDRTAPELNL